MYRGTRRLGTRNASSIGFMQGNEHADSKSFNQRLLKILGVVLTSALIVFGSDVFLLLFAGILLAIFLRSLSGALSHLIRFPAGISLSFVVISLFVFGIASYALIAPSIGEQVDELVKVIPQGIEKVESYLRRVDAAESLRSSQLSSELFAGGSQVLSKTGGFISGTLGWLANFLIIFFLGLYIAAEPKTYERGLLRLVPISKRSRATEVLSEVQDTLKWWLIGKILAMVVIGVLTTVGLWLLDVPIALTLGILAAAFTFIPNIGPIVSAIPAVLLGLVDSPAKALYIVLLYFGIQTVESYLLTPLVQRRTISLAPALTLSAQILLGVLFGVLGVALATPLIAAIVVLTRMLYVEDALGDRVSSRDTSSLTKAN